MGNKGKIVLDKMVYCVLYYTQIRTMKNLMKRAGIALVLCTLMILSSNAIFAQNNSGRGIPFVEPEPQPIVQQPVEKIPTQPQQQPITIINNWPEWQRPVEPRPRVIYLPSRPRVVTPPAEPKKDTGAAKELPPPPPQMFSQKELICIGGFMFLLIAGIIGYLIAGRRNYYGCNGNCNVCQRRNCNDCNLNVSGCVDVQNKGIPERVIHEHNHKHEGEISLVVPQDLNKAEVRSPESEQSK